MQKSILQVQKDIIDFLKKSTSDILNETDQKKLVFITIAEFEKHHHTNSSTANFIRLIESIFDKRFFLQESVKYPHHIEIVVAICCNSNYLTDIIVRNPELLYLIFDPAYLDEKLLLSKMLSEIRVGTKKFKHFETKINFLKLFKRRNTLRIGLNDILGNHKLLKVTENISILAKSIVNELFAICYNEVCKKYKVENVKSSYVLAALGKLGGNELNYSSDIDLILFFEHNIELESTVRKIDYYELLSETAQLFIKQCSEITEKGFLYRVDFRLRPDGRNSPICRTLPDYIRYYETRGEDWERQMLIKLGYVGGNRILYDNFTKSISSFIYPATISASPLKQVEKMKKQIEINAGNEQNVKTFTGGIRDIEFSVQALQLLSGGMINSIRTGNTIEAIDFLRNNSLLSDIEADTLTRAYNFYRRIEHYLQLMNDLQTHSIPLPGELFDKLIYFLGYENEQEFKYELKKFRTEVRAIFNEIVNPKKIDLSETDPLAEINFTDKKRADRNFIFLKTGAGLLNQKEFDSRTIKLFEEIEKSFLAELREYADPDTVLDNVVRILKNITFVSIWYTEFKNKTFLKDFLFLCAFSQRAVNIFSRNNQTCEYLLSKNIFGKITEEELNNYSMEDIQAILAAQFSLGLIGTTGLNKTLANYFDKKISMISKEFIEKYDVSIITAGSYGIRECGFASDVDLIVVSKEEYSVEIENDFKNILAEINRTLFPFKADCRLRPEGQSSQLVWSLDEFNKYILKRARIWEFQAFLKSRSICGNTNLLQSLINTIGKRLDGLTADETKEEIRTMYKKAVSKEFSSMGNLFNLKKNKGSMLDIDFILDSIILTDSKHYTKCAGLNTREKINYVTQLSDEHNELNQLFEFFIHLKLMEATIQCLFDKNNYLVPSDTKQEEALNTFMQHFNIIDYNEETVLTSKSILQFTEKYLLKEKQ